MSKKKLSHTEAQKLIESEFAKIQSAMQDEIKGALDQEQMFNARTSVMLIEYADQLAERLILHASLHELSTGNPARDDEELIKAYKEFRQKLPI